MNGEGEKPPKVLIVSVVYAMQTSNLSRPGVSRVSAKRLWLSTNMHVDQLNN